MITIVKRPEKFSPSENPVIWQVSSDQPTLVYFRVVLIDDDSSAIINQLDIFPTPALPQGSYINLSKLLGNVVNWEVNNDSFQLVSPIQNTVRSYRLKITERILNTAVGQIFDHDVYDNTSDVNYVFNAELGRITHHNYLQAKYVVNKHSVASFLTNKPNFVKVNDITAEHLYFLYGGNMPALFVRVKLFNSSGVMINMVSEQIQDLNDYNMYRLNISPKALKDNSNVDFTNVAYYVVDLADNFGQARIVERTYQYEEVECWRDYMNVMWVNSLGGLDSYQFIAPQDTITLNKFQMKRNLYGINSDGLYSDVNDNVYNPSDVLINNKVTTTTRVVSKELRDAESYWLQELFSSKQAFVELTDMALVPLLVNNTSYSIPRLKYNRGNLNIISADFTLADGIIPTGAQAFGNSVSSIQFINSQMNTIQNNLPGFGIATTPTGHHIYSGNYSHNYM